MSVGSLNLPDKQQGAFAQIGASSPSGKALAGGHPRGDLSR